MGGLSTFGGTSPTNALNPQNQFGPSDGNDDNIQQQQQQQDPLSGHTFNYSNGQSSPSSPTSAFQYNDEHVNKLERYRKYKIFFFIALAALGLVILGFAILGDVPDRESKPFLTILQMNDVYELGAVGGMGGFPKVASYHKQLTKSEPHLMTVLAGDFFSPSALGVAQVQVNPDEPEKPLHGRQIVDAMNHLGSKQDDFLVTFGNHEYDISEESFYSRIQESKFTYLSTNVNPANGHVWPTNVVPYFFKKIGQRTIAFISLSILVDSSLPYIKQHTFKESIKLIRDTIDSFKTDNKPYDILVGITHQSLADDSNLVAEIPELDLVMGGHEHENWRINRSMNPRHPVYICKADANAKTVFKHSFRWDESKLVGVVPKPTPFGTASQVEGLLTITSDLVAMDHHIPEDKAMVEITNYWTTLGFEAFVKKGLDPGRVMCHLTEYINAMDKVTRGTVSKIGSFMADAFLHVTTVDEPYTIPDQPNYSQKLFSISNIGSVRIDDYLVMGDLYEYDALRILPFGGQIVIMEITGTKLLQMLDRIRGLLGTGMWMGYNPTQLICPGVGDGLPSSGCQWHIGDEKIINNEDTIYSMVCSSYVSQIGWVEWFTSQDDFKVVKTFDIDQQHALINHFGRMYPIPTNSKKY